jgi:Domain of unknown function (DUF4150)
VGTNVFANGLEVAAKKSDNQSIAAMPDVCLSPPSPPAGPLPIPYPNFSNASDMSDGTKTVKIAGDEAGMKDQSNYKTSKGDEAATRTFGMGVVSHSIQGKTYFAAWSSDVMFEGANAVRFMDMTTHNHGSPSNPPSATASTGTPAKPPPNPECEKLDQENQDRRNELADKTEDKTLVGENGDGKGTTVASSKFSPTGGGSTTITSAHNNHKAYEFCKKSLAKGGNKKDRKAGKSNLCPEAKYKHARPRMQKSGHSEARMFDQLGGKGILGPGRITFNIDWRPKDPDAPNSSMPCPDCHKMMCAAAEHCELKIFLCDNDNQKKQLTSKHCPAEPASYQALQKTMGEIP